LHFLLLANIVLSAVCFISFLVENMGWLAAGGVEASSRLGSVAESRFDFQCQTGDKVES